MHESYCGTSRRAPRARLGRADHHSICPFIDENVIELDKDTIRTEVAYGWPDLNVLIGNDRSRHPLEDC
jgi:hypothetical protein